MSLYRVDGIEVPCALLRKVDDFGVESLDLARPPTRFWADAETIPNVVLPNTDGRRTRALPPPSALLGTLPPEDTWLRMTRRSLARLRAWFLITEDPQRRLDAQPVATLAHQASLVRHVLDEPSLNRVLIADEVGLGKTVEAGLILKNLIAANPGLRIVYFAPARLVPNVHTEFQRLDLKFRTWVAGNESTAALDDNRVLASIHRAAFDTNLEKFVKAPAWDIILVDECHHLSDWAPGGGSPGRKYKLINELQERLTPNGRLILLSGTPHQGHSARFANLLALLKNPKEELEAVRGRVIYRIKDDVRDWNGAPLFPKRQVNPALVLDLGADHRKWLTDIHEFFEPGHVPIGKNAQARKRAAGWRCGQALQWATSSIQAGLGYLVRQGIRAGFDLDKPGMREAVAALRPYRMGPKAERVEDLYRRMEKEVGRQLQYEDVEDLEDYEDEGGSWKPDLKQLALVLEEGVALLREAGDAKWREIQSKLLRDVGDEKVVLFAQPIETVTALAQFLERESGARPALIIGNQEEADRKKEIDAFWRPDGPQFLLSSRAGGEGLNLQVARRLIHVDVPWNPMEMEQRVGRVHRFKSKRTILVDTVVVKDSREVDTFAVARRKLQLIAGTMVSPERFEGLYARVMSLVPPEELQDVLCEGPLGPLSNEEQERIGHLVAAGFQRWREFDDQYSDQQRRIRDLDPGQADWEDLDSFAAESLGAKKAEGFTSLRFQYEDGEVKEASREATVLIVDGDHFACGDYGGMPVTRADGTSAQMLGLNQPKVAAALRTAAFPPELVGAGYVKWPAGCPLPVEAVAKPFGVLAVARQGIRWGANGQGDAGAALRLFVVTPQKTDEVTGKAVGDLVRGLLAATVRTDPQPQPELLERLRADEERLLQELRRPTEEERAAGIGFGVVPLIAAVVE